MPENSIYWEDFAVSKESVDLAIQREDREYINMD